MKPGDGLILDDEIPPPVLIVKSISTATLEYDRIDRHGGKKLCIITCRTGNFVHLGNHNGVCVYGYPENGISEARLKELFEILILSPDQHRDMREKAIQEIADNYEKKLIDAKNIAENSQPPSVQIAKQSLAELDHFRAKFQPQSHNEQYLRGEPFVASLELVKADGTKEFLLICRGYTPLRLDPLTQGAMFASYLSPKGSLAAMLPGMTSNFSTRYRSDDNRSVLIWKSTFTPTLNDLTDALIATQGKLTRVNSMRKFDIFHEVGIPVAEKPADKLVIEPPPALSPKAPNLGTDVPAKSVPLPARATSVEPTQPPVSISESQKMTPDYPSEQIPSLVPPAAPHRQSSERGVALPMKAILDPIQDAIFRSPLNSRIRISGGPGTGKTTVLLKRLSQKNKFEYLTDEEKGLFRGDRGWKEQDWYLFSPSDLLKGYLEKALAKELLPAGDEHVKVYSTFRNEILRDLGVLRVGKHGALTFVADVNDANQHGKYVDRDYVVSFARHLQGFYTKTIEQHATAIASELCRIRQMVLDHIGDSPATAAEPILTEVEAIERQIAATTFSEPIRAREFVQRAVQLADRTNSAHGILMRSILVASVLKKNSEKLTTLARIKPLELVFERMPELYLEFRDKNPFPGAHTSRNVCSTELDLLLFAVLETLHQLWDVIKDESLRVPAKIKNLAGLLRVNICIDEVTDFSPLEVACMEKFAVPRIGGITICGDLMQRVTSRGIGNWLQLDIFSRGLTGHELAIAYRQTGRLFAIAKDLFLAKTGFEGVDFKSAYPLLETDPPALSVRLETAEHIANWVSERIFEIFALCGQHLPTVAILVPDCDSIETIASRLRVLLVPAGIEVDASPSGALLGNPSRIRVFPVTAIKGLEFEAVFYVDLDIMAKLQPDLIDKYVYVGLSRARRFLGVTYRETFPIELEEIVTHFHERECFAIDGEMPQGDEHPLIPSFDGSSV